MVTQTEKTGTIASAIDDLASVLSSASGWSDADGGMTNSGNSTKFYDNGRVFYNSNTATFVSFFASAVDNSNYYVDEDGNRDYAEGIRMVHSTDWDTDKHVPDGYTMTCRGDPFSGLVHRRREDSHATYPSLYKNRDHDQSGMGLWILKTNESLSNLRDREATYFFSAGSSWLSAGIWNTSDGSSGIASFYAWEYLQNMFWNPGRAPVAVTYRTSVQNNSGNAEGFTQSMFMDYTFDRYMTGGMVGHNNGAFSLADWGVLNPDANDDTFFVRRPVIYDGYNRGSVVAFVNNHLPNDLQEGVAHGDIVSFDGVDYRGMSQSGASVSNPVSVCMRFE